MLKKSLYLGAVSALSIALAAPGWAQEAQEPQAQEQQAQETGEEAGVREIIVTAQRRSQNIQAVPIAITAIDEEALAQSSVKDIRDIAGRVPSLVIDSVNAGPRAAGVSLRGISFEDIEKSFDPAVGVVVDGVFIGTNTGQLLDVFDLESIEVLRGPQGTLFGRNTIAGVINISRAKPTGELGGKASFGFADFGTRRGRFVINSPKIANVLSLKGFFFYDDTDGFYRNVTQNRRAGNYEVITGGGTARFQPTDNIDLVVTYEHVRERGETQSTPLSSTPNLAFGPTNDLICLSVPAGPGFVRAFGIPDAQCDRENLVPDGLYTTFSNIEQPVTNDGDNVYAEFNLNLGRFKFTSVTGFQTNRESVRQDFDSASINFFDTLREQDYRQFTQEFRIVGDITENINLLLGAYYFDSEYQLRQTTNFGPGVLAPTTVTLGAFTDHTSRSYAGFADAQFKPTSRLTIGVGGRYTVDEKSIFNNFGQVTALVRLSIPTFTNECVAVTGLLAPGVPRFGLVDNCSGAASFDRFTWRALAQYEVDDNKRVYASFSTGFRSGGFNGRAASPTSLGPYNPEDVISYEIGLKADWFNRIFRTNIAAYITNYSDKQEEVVQPSPPGAANPQETVVRNAANAQIKGIEAEFVFQPTRNFSINGSLSVLDARYINFFRDVTGDLIPDDVSSLDLRRAPTVTWSIGADYQREILSGTFAANTNFRFTDQYTTCIIADPIALQSNVVTNDRRCLATDRFILDGNLSYTFAVGRYELKSSLFARNLLDNRGISGTLPVAGLFTFATARPPASSAVRYKLSSRVRRRYNDLNPSVAAQ